MDDESIGKMIALLFQLRALSHELAHFGVKVNIDQKGCAICPFKAR